MPRWYRYITNSYGFRRYWTNTIFVRNDDSEQVRVLGDNVPAIMPKKVASEHFKIVRPVLDLNCSHLIDILWNRKIKTSSHN